MRLQGVFTGVALLVLARTGKGQLRGKDALVSWFGAAGCDPASTQRSLVIAVQGFAQRVPNGVSYPSYIVNCSSSRDGSGTIRYCRDVMGLECPINAPFSSAITCLPNDPVLFGSSSVAVQCPSSDSELVIPAIESLGPSDVEVNWFALPGCGQPVGPNIDRSIVVVRGGVCNRVPNAPTTGSGYRVTCGSESIGLFEFCSASDCSVCESAVPFSSQQCLQNDVTRFGSASYAVRCPAAPSTSLQGVSPSGGLSGGAGAGSGSGPSVSTGGGGPTAAAAAAASGPGAGAGAGAGAAVGGVLAAGGVVVVTNPSSGAAAILIRPGTTTGTPDDVGAVPSPTTGAAAPGTGTTGGAAPVPEAPGSDSSGAGAALLSAMTVAALTLAVLASA